MEKTSMVLKPRNASKGSAAGESEMTTNRTNENPLTCLGTERSAAMVQLGTDSQRNVTVKGRLGSPNPMGNDTASKPVVPRIQPTNKGAKSS